MDAPTPRTSYLICATPRTGSYLLCEVLTRTGLAGRPAEYFWHQHEPRWKAAWGAATYREYVAGALREATTANGVFGVKTMWHYMAELTARLRDLHGQPDLKTHALLTRTFPNLHYIFLTRRDKVRQAISHWRALQTGIWMQKEDVARARAPTFDHAAVKRLVREAQEQDEAWRAYFQCHAIVPLTLEYEEFVGAQEDTAHRVLDFLGISVGRRLDLRPGHLRRQSDEVTEEWVRRYLACDAKVDSERLEL